MNEERADHAIVIDRTTGVRFICQAREGSVCRLGCVAECEDTHLHECDRSTKDTGSCGALPFLESGDALDTYIGSIGTQNWDSGPIEIEWDSYYESWVWRFPNEDRELPGGRRFRDAV